MFQKIIDAEKAVNRAKDAYYQGLMSLPSEEIEKLEKNLLTKREEYEILLKRFRNV